MIIGALGKLLRLEKARHQKRVAEIKKVVDAVETLAAENDSNEEIDVASSFALLGRKASTPLAKIVLNAIKQLERDSFTLDSLCEIIERDNPKLILDRAAVSRRIYELRVCEEPKIEAVTDLDCRLKGRQKLYRYIGPP